MKMPKDLSLPQGGSSRPRNRKSLSAIPINRNCPDSRDQLLGLRQFYDTPFRGKVKSIFGRIAWICQKASFSLIKFPSPFLIQISIRYLQVWTRKGIGKLYSDLGFRYYRSLRLGNISFIRTLPHRRFKR